MAKTLKQQRINRFLPAFTLIELTIVVIVIGLLAGLVSLSAASIQKSSRDTARDANVKILSTALEKYYRENGEYPSVALMTSQDVATLRQKLDVVNANTFKLPLTDAATKNSIVTSSPSPTRLLYSANTTDSTKNTQCQTSLTGYCDGYQLQYQKESDSSIVIAKSLHDTFTPVPGTATCAAGETQSGNTCTKTYAATYQTGTYSCPSGGTLSGTTCTSTYAATYNSGGYYSCPSGGTLSGTTCTTTTTYAATAGTSEQCPSGTSWWPNANYSLCGQSYAAYYQNSYYSCPGSGTLSGTTCTTYVSGVTTYTCAHPNYDSLNAQNRCRHERPNYTTQSGCEAAGYTWGGSNCFNMHDANSSTTYSCPSGYSPTPSTSPTHCETTATYTSGYYYCQYGVGHSLIGSTCWHSQTDPVTVTTYSCPSGGTLSGSTCTTSSSYAATYNASSGYYSCPSGGTLSGSTCTTSYAATQGSGYYYCADGGTLSGTTCTYTYTLP